MTPTQQEEYRALRETIRSRGSARVWVFITGFVAWAALTMATAALAQLPIATLLPLLLLAATFEAVFSIHVGVERIGRYIQVFLEEEKGWEHMAMAFGRPASGTKTDPLFTMCFLIATMFNFVPVLLVQPVALEVSVVGLAHVFVAVRFVLARRAASHQREADLKRFLELKTQ